MTPRGQRVVCTERATPTGESIGLFRTHRGPPRFGARGGCGGLDSQYDVHQASSRGSPSRRDHVQRPNLDAPSRNSGRPIPYGGTTDKYMPESSMNWVSRNEEFALTLESPLFFWLA